MFDFKNINVRLLIINTTLIIAGFFLSDPFHIFESSYEKAGKIVKISSTADIKSVKIINPENSGNEIIHLTKDPNGWSVKSEGQKMDFPAVSNRIESALENLMSLRRYHEITSNSEKYSDFGVPEAGFRLEITTADKTYTLHIGNQGSAYNTTLVRLKEDKTVYSVKGNLRSDWNQNVDFFRNKRIFQIAKENINELIATGLKNYHLQSAEKDVWNLIQGGNFAPTQSTRINRLLDDLSSLEGMEFYYAVNTGIPVGNIKIILKSNVELNLSVHKMGNEYLVKSEQNPYWQKLPEYRLNSLFPMPTEMINNRNP